MAVWKFNVRLTAAYDVVGILLLQKFHMFWRVIKKLNVNILIFLLYEANVTSCTKENQLPEVSNKSHTQK